MNKNKLWKAKLKESINHYKYLLMSWNICFKKHVKMKRDLFKQSWQLIVLNNKSSDSELKKIVEKHNNNSQWSNILTYIIAPILCLFFGLWAALK